MTIHLEKRAFERGYDASYIEYKSIEECPYDSDILKQAWLEGFELGKESKNEK